MSLVLEFRNSAFERYKRARESFLKQVKLDPFRHLSHLEQQIQVLEAKLELSEGNINIHTHLQGPLYKEDLEAITPELLKKLIDLPKRSLVFILDGRLIVWNTDSGEVKAL